MDLICAVYSHTDFLSILEVQTDYIKKLKDINIVLFINKNAKDLNLDYIFNSYDDVYFYDDTYPYAHRLSECIDNIDSKYVFFIHDIDILINYDDVVFKKLLNTIDEYDIDRLDLKIFGGWEGETKNLIFTLYKSDDEKIFFDDQTTLIRQTNTNLFIYNVNPSIWKTTVFKNIHSLFIDRNYRNIEDGDVQMYCSKFRIFRISTENYIESGYFTCAKFFIYLHITHGGALLPNTDLFGHGVFKTEFGQRFESLSDEYIKIIEKYKLKETKHGIGRIL